MFGTHGHLFGTDTVISCPHGGRAVAAFAAASDAVRIDGAPVATAAGAWTVIGCTRTVDGAPAPCTSVRWDAERDGVVVDGVPVLLDVTHAQCFTAHLVPAGRPVVAPARREVAAG
ncbi:hypothetical protein [Streptomyces sp. TS71-3]|uniref:hypothetical protein n=1 Tax=Streptomyces sp. TS71-3 TaxID=2733862 RepID=UPI001B173C7A|nr:hypothetical protein [Streptomyces sp. TS71-3]GHJ35074.1 hypothetical protein Sm713_06830 [Streptomyces sp. TS71-3]